VEKQAQYVTPKEQNRGMKRNGHGKSYVAGAPQAAAFATQRDKQYSYGTRGSTKWRRENESLEVD
jgi:hypothetical protein